MMAILIMMMIVVTIALSLIAVMVFLIFHPKTVTTATLTTPTLVHSFASTPLVVTVGYRLAKNATTAT